MSQHCGPSLQYVRARYEVYRAACHARDPFPATRPHRLYDARRTLHSGCRAISCARAMFPAKVITCWRPGPPAIASCLYHSVVGCWSIHHPCIRATTRAWPGVSPAFMPGACVTSGGGHPGRGVYSKRAKVKKAARTAGMCIPPRRKARLSMATDEQATQHNMTDYDQARRDFTWQVPADYNFAITTIGHWAEHPE